MAGYWLLTRRKTMIFAIYNEAGVITGRYDEAIHGPRFVVVDGGFVDNPESKIPLDAIEITAEQYALSLDERLVVDPDTLTIIELPIRPSFSHVVVDGQWVLDVAALKAAKGTELRLACGAACEAGHTSNALGSNHYYATDGSYSQVNLLGHHLDAMANTADPAWTQEITCVPEGETTSTRVAHTAAQTVAVTVPVKQMIEGNRSKYNAKKHYVLNMDPASPTIEADIAAVTWESVEE
jgi:hypothetical protein